MYTFFWNGPFSNWYPSPFNALKKSFTCNEQYMMYCKAIAFNDKETANAIMATSNPEKQKELGRQVKGFVEEDWLAIRETVVYSGLVEKFRQNPELLQELKETEGTTLVEASPYDRIWGIGFLEVNALEHVEEWGENLLGKLLTRLREKICRI